MANEENDIKLISRNNSGFPDWLDFSKLRSEGIDYIGKLSGKIWTDHNVHDPGITTLEVLCYALLDLGYRTNLPVKDIFARDPEDKTPDDNFFTPSEILTVNPLTITDFRKVLIDIPGIKNAWLEVATDQHADDVCKVDLNSFPGVAGFNSDQEKDPCCDDYLNGLYHVYVDTEKDLNDPASIKNKERECLTEKIRNVLMAHRNICEDFLDVTFLCKWKIGVCADIELDDDADPEKVYLEMIGQLRQFFSPSPRFYTLAQMLEKNKGMDEIFAGRPLDIRDSHGFIDTEELEKLELNKTIHLSDVYSVLFSVKGISKIRRLRLVNCEGPVKNLDQWIVKVPEGSVPDFNIGCSGFAFNRRGIPVSFDFKKYESLLEINFEHNGKILYTWPSDKLDAEIPKGVFQKGLGTYSSIQNEFPRVYGIAEGGLPDNVPAKRKAQALQFKGYLLFFDHLLGNYLSQLQHIRSLFPIRTNSGNGRKKSATYFSTLPGNVPDFQQLVRYRIDESSSVTVGETGYLAFPVSKNDFQAILDQQKQDTVNIEELPHYYFNSATEKNIAVAQLQDDMLNEAYDIRYVTKQDECVYYYVVSSSEDFILVSRKYYPDEKSAMVAASSIKYAGTIRSSYRSSIGGDSDGYSFSLELNVTGYASFLQQLTEDEVLYNQRREAFLDHLLARFAETFTDYALLSYQLYSADDLQMKNVQAKQSYLYNYPLLSSTRGKAFDYTRNGWHTDNISGYEKRIRALLGHQELKRKTLCNFEVYDYGEKFVFKLKLSPAVVIKTQDKFDTKEEAGKAAQQLFDALALRSNYYAGTLPYREGARIFIKYGTAGQAELDTVYSSVQEAEKAAGYFHKMMALPAANGFVRVIDYQHTILLRRADHTPVRKFNSLYNSKEQAGNAARKAINKINDPAIWNLTDTTIGKLLVNSSQQEKVWLIDETQFKIDVDNNIIGNPDLHIYELLDKGNHFLFRSIEQFTDAKKAKEACVHAIRLLANEENLRVQKTKDEGKWTVSIIDHESSVAQCSVVLSSQDEAELLRNEIWQVIAPYVYYFDPEATPYTRKFYYNFGYEEGKTVVMESSGVYHSEEEAESALAVFSKAVSKSYLRRSGNEWQLVSDNGKRRVLGHFPGAGDEQIKSVSQWLDVQKELSGIKEAKQDEKTFASYVDVHEESKCHYFYHLVNKDGLYAVSDNSFADRSSALNGLPNAFNHASSLLDFLELQMSGAVSEYIIPETNTKWYHYRLVSQNNIAKPLGGSAQKLVLFESTKGYLSKEDAEKAFAENYLEILTFALDKNNYGEGKPISEEEIFNRDKNDCSRSDTIAYVPAETLSFLGSYPQQAIGELIKIVLTYPVRTVKKEQQANVFKELFQRCEPEGLPECKPKKSEPCYSEEEKPVCYFALFDKQLNSTVWQSVEYYDSAAEAMKAFRFFIFLLKYPANYTVLPDCEGGYRLYVREVLAESRSKYFTKAMAWGEQGIQKFIGVSQQPCSFHAYTDEDCCFRFFVACNNTRVFHPCTYDSPVVRDRVIKQLQHFLPAVLKWKFNFCQSKWNGGLHDFEGNLIAKVAIEGAWKPANLLDAYLDLFILIGNFCLSINDKEGLVSIDTGQNLVVKFYPAAGQSLSELKEKLIWLSCYFPFARKTEANNIVVYCIEIRLPGFNICDPCNDGSEPCPVAWTSDCCFTSCDELLNAYDLILSWLGKSEFYKPVFDCPCGSYGIELYDDTPECIVNARQSMQASFALPKIIAVSPQCYYSAEMVCEAIERAKRLINSEGLHLVEHILLRPHCPEDCKCLIQPCPPSDSKDSPDNCRFPYWVVKDDDPCNKTRPVCFYPGKDPYSFIATVVLPAWPERFRNKDNLLLLENMLQREMPAHVALRILWLTPHDMCCFESKFKDWLMWTAYEKARTDASVPCNLVDFLFRREFECLSEETPCLPCDNEVTVTENCVKKMQEEEEALLAKKSQCRTMSWAEQLNEIFCWPGPNCKEDFYLECDEPLAPEIKTRNDIIHPTQEEIITPAAGLEEKKQSQPQFLNSRRASRKKKIDAVIKALGEKELLIKTKRFLESASPSATLLNRLVKDLVAVSAKEKKTTAKKQLPVRELVTLAVHSYLDKLSAGEDVEKLDQLQPVIELLEKTDFDLKAMYREWLPERMAEYVSQKYIAEIEKKFT